MIVGRRVRWEKGKEYLLGHVELIRKELDKMEWLIKNREDFEKRHPSNNAGLELGLAMDAILMYLNHIFEYYKNGKPITLAEYLTLRNS